MGAAKSLPVIGETVTIVESGVKLGVACPFLIAGHSAGKELVHSAGDAWIDYTNRNAIAAPIKILSKTMSDDKEGAKEVAVKFGHSWVELGESTPLIGHGIGVGYYLTGNTEGGNRCMECATREGVVAAASFAVGIATGGLGTLAVIACGVGAAAVGGLAYDGTATGVKSAIKGEYSPSGTILVSSEIAKDPTAVKMVEFGLCVAGNLAGGPIAIQHTEKGRSTTGMGTSIEASNVGDTTENSR